MSVSVVAAKEFKDNCVSPNSENLQMHRFYENGIPLQPEDATSCTANSRCIWLSDIEVRHCGVLPIGSKLCYHVTVLCKGQIPLGSVPRYFLVANVMRKSPTRCGLVTRKSGVLGMSPTCYEEVGDVANMSARKLRGS